MYPEPNTDSPARLSTRQTGSPGMIYTARYGSPKRQLQFYSLRGLKKPVIFVLTTTSLLNEQRGAKPLHESPASE
ncbi:hypothetical protein AOLI_G00162080 [Acnodon oligacanthus]